MHNERQTSRVAAIALVGALAVLYLAAKVHFVTRFDGDVGSYLIGHWPYWAGMAIVGLLLSLAGPLARRHVRGGTPRS
jgi:hypothetical protein